MSVLVFKHSELNENMIKVVVFERGADGLDLLVGNLHIRKSYWAKFKEREEKSEDVCFEEDVFFEGD